jgi:hypothetical protein
MDQSLASDEERTKKDDANMKKYKMLSRTSMLMNVFTRKLEVPRVALLSIILPRETLMAKKKSKISKQRTGMNR